MDVKETLKPYPLNKFILDTLGMLLGFALCYWMGSLFENFEQWFEGRRSDGYAFLLGVAIIAICFWSMAKGLIALIRARFSGQHDT